MMLAALQRGDGGFEQGPRFLFPLLLIALMVFVVSRLRRRRVQYMAGYGVVSPMTTLGDRFARGEIDQVEFDHRKAVLKGDKEVPPAPSRSAPPAPSGSSTSQGAAAPGGVDASDVEPDDGSVE